MRYSTLASAAAKAALDVVDQAIPDACTNKGPCGDKFAERLYEMIHDALCEHDRKSVVEVDEEIEAPF